MDENSAPVAVPENQSRSNMLYALILVAIILIGGVGIFLLLSRNQPVKKVTINSNQPVENPVNNFNISVSNTESSFLIDPSFEDVRIAGYHYTVIARIADIKQEGNIFVVTLSSQKGEEIIADLQVDENGVVQSGVYNAQTGEITPISVSQFKNGDLVEMNIIGNLKTGDYQVTNILRRS